MKTATPCPVCKAVAPYETAGCVACAYLRLHEKEHLIAMGGNSGGLAGNEQVASSGNKGGIVDSGGTSGGRIGDDSQLA